MAPQGLGLMAAIERARVLIAPPWSAWVGRVSLTPIEYFEPGQMFCIRLYPDRRTVSGTSETIEAVRAALGAPTLSDEELAAIVWWQVVERPATTSAQPEVQDAH